jgi:hypothetical protein
MMLFVGDNQTANLESDPIFVQQLIEIQTSVVKKRLVLNVWINMEQDTSTSSLLSHKHLAIRR